jgi:hypothetical protein
MFSIVVHGLQTRWSLLSSSMKDHGSSRDRAPDSRAGAALRFLTELVAWIATPWALWSHSKLLAVASVVILIGLPTVLATPGDKAHVLVPVRGPVTIVLNVLQFIAALVSSWIAWPTVVNTAVTLLVVAAAVSQLSRWRWLLTAKR